MIRRLQYASGITPRIPSVADDVDRKACLSAPLPNRQRPIPVRQCRRGASVLRLLHARGPAAIGRRIGAIVVDAIQGIARGPGTHVSEERRVVVQPASAHRDTAAAVKAIRLMGRIQASLFGATPGRIFPAAVTIASTNQRAVLQPDVSRVRAEVHSAASASTTHRVAVSQVVRLRDGGAAAIALDMPAGSLPGWFGAAGDSQATKSLAREVET